MGLVSRPVSGLYRVHNVKQLALPGPSNRPRSVRRPEAASEPLRCHNI
jgi:hypothetical protein